MVETLTVFLYNLLTFFAWCKDGKFNMNTGDGVDVIVGGVTKKIGFSRAKVEKGPHTIIKKDKFENVDIDAKNRKENLAAMPEQSLRPSWRQIR